MKIEWHPTLATGDMQIDAHHRAMLEKINELIVACKERRETAVVHELLGFLQQYVEEHFAAEESYLRQHKVANMHEHCRQHQQLKRQLDELEKSCNQEGVSLAVVTNSLKLTYLWLKEHIQVMDCSMVSAAATSRV